MFFETNVIFALLSVFEHNKNILSPQHSLHKRYTENKVEMKNEKSAKLALFKYTSNFYFFLYDILVFSLFIWKVNSQV